MKKILYLMLASAVLFASCAKDPIENTATVDMAGEWYVTVDLADETGAVIMEDPYGVGSMIFSTFNTAADKASEMYVFDNYNFWEFQVQVNADPDKMTFSTDGMAPNVIYESNVQIMSGKITKAGAKTPSGVPADAIEFLLKFDDDDPSYVYKVHGFRYSGFVADE
jgi:hypothetical protein